MARNIEKQRKETENLAILILFGLILVAIGLFYSDIEIIYKSNDISFYLIALFILYMGFLELLSIGLKNIFTFPGILNLDKIFKLSPGKIVDVVTVLGLFIIVVLAIFGLDIGDSGLLRGFIITQGVLVIIRGVQNYLTR